MDNRSLDQLQQFAGFLEFLSKPEEYKQLLANLKKAANEYNEEANGIRATKEFQLWRNEQLAILDKRGAKIVADKEALEAKVAEDLKAIEKAYLELDKNKEATSKAWEEVSAKLATLVGVTKATEDLVKKQEAFAKVQEVHFAKAAEFDRKAAAFAALIKE